jgi:hypothetical protein
MVEFCPIDDEIRAFSGQPQRPQLAVNEILGESR